jgi:selenocysteine lyase/cysteine desulfurase
MGQAALHASTTLLLDYGMENVGRRVLDNSRFLIEELGELPGLRLSSASEEQRRSGIVSFTHERMQATAVHQHLVKAGVSAVVREGSIRLSPHFYQGETQLSEFMQILQAAIA